MPTIDPETLASAVSNFKTLLDRPDVLEGEIQTFLEDNTALIPLPHLLGHDLHMGCIISKFELDRCRVPDFAYLTKNSGFWRLVLVELERPQKSIFTQATRAKFHGDTQEAIAQIEDWKNRVKTNMKDVRELLTPLMVPTLFRKNQMEVKYVLIIGRNESGQCSAEESGRLHRLEEEGHITLMTYDTIIRLKEHQLQRVGYLKNILVHRRNAYRMKALNRDSTHLLSWYGPDDIELSPDQMQWFRDRDYDIDAWLRREPLILDGKWPDSRRKEFYAGRRNTAPSSPQTPPITFGPM
jgi:hypothetical protein